MCPKSKAPTTIRDRIIELRRVPARQLIRNPANWRRHPEPQRAALRALLSEIGMADALLARQTPDGLVLIDGHLRAEELPNADVPVLILDVTEAEADKMLLTLDPLAAMAEMEGTAVKALLERLQWNADDGLRALLDDLASRADKLLSLREGLTDPDDVPPMPEEPVSKRGDVWLCGEHRVMCGDAMSAEDVGRLLDGARPRLTVTDPPYGINYDPEWRNIQAAKGNLAYANRRIGKIPNDDRSDWSAAWALVPSDVIYSWHPPGATSLVHAAALQDSGMRCEKESQHILQMIGRRLRSGKSI